MNDEMKHQIAASGRYKQAITVQSRKDGMVLRVESVVSTDALRRICRTRGLRHPGHFVQ
jgi:hypothetical protein